MEKVILVTGSTDGIGFATAKSLLELGHKVLLHGRDNTKLENSKRELLNFYENSKIETYLADLSNMTDVVKLANEISRSHNKLDVIINNAGVFALPLGQTSETNDGLDVRFAVNTIAPYLLTMLLLPLLNDKSRVLNVSSAAQASVSPEELFQPSTLSANEIYAKSKLALTMWTAHLAKEHGQKAPAFIAINPKSLLGSKMVKDAFGIDGANVQIGADVLVLAALSDDFSEATGLYYDNDIGHFGLPHEDASNPAKKVALTEALEDYIVRYL